MKKIIFVSTGRCGTKRLYEILKTKDLEAVVKHQMAFSRFANIVGNFIFLFDFKVSESVKNKLYNFITSKFLYKKYFLCTDPLTSMMIPKKVIDDQDTMIVHIIRPEHEVAVSFYKISRERLKSFIAQNLIPFWQISIFPFENLINRKIIEKYQKTCTIKNNYLSNRYSSNPNYKKITMKQVFQSDVIKRILKTFLEENVVFSPEEMAVKSNFSR